MLGPGLPPSPEPWVPGLWFRGSLLSPEAQTLFPLHPTPCLTSGVTEQNSHPPHHLHGCSRTCCGSRCRLPQATMPPYSAASPPAILPISSSQETPGKVDLHCLPNTLTPLPPCQGFASARSALLSPPPSEELLFILQSPEFTSVVKHLPGRLIAPSTVPQNSW